MRAAEDMIDWKALAKINQVTYPIISECALPGYPGVYSDIAYFSNWIQQSIIEDNA